ncbi:MAG: acylphosphatase [Bacteroidales bacterium]
MGDKVLYKIRITGKVQGVGFRWNAVMEARSLSITGFVKNMPDGSVYIEAEGLREQLTVFLEWCKKGPAFGYVESIKADLFPPADHTDFHYE